MFSGGIDSTASAIKMSDHYDRVHLVTYKNGYGHYYFERTTKRVQELNQKLGNRFRYTLISTKSYFDQILVNNVLKDYKNTVPDSFGSWDARWRCTCGPLSTALRMAFAL